MTTGTHEPGRAAHASQSTAEWSSPKPLSKIGVTYGGLSGKTKAHFGHGNARYVTFLNVLENIAVDLDQLDYVAVAPGEKQNAVMKGDILFNGTSETPEDLAYGCVLEQDVPGLFLNSFCFGFRVRNRQEHHPKFLAYWFRGPAGRHSMSALAQGATRYNMSKRQFLKLELALPDYEEQSAIAEALSDVDGLIAALEKLIAKKRAIKEATMQQLLTGKTRLPGFSGAWNDTTIAAVADIRNGSTPSTQVPAYWNGSIPWCTPTDITGTRSKYLKRTIRSITEAGLASCAASLLPPGTLLLCSRATIGELKIARTHVCTNQGFKSLVCHDGTSHEFLYYLIQTLKPQLIERAIGSTFLEIGKRDLAAISLTIPLENEQAAIAEVLSDMDREIESLEHRRDKTQKIKQGMMQQLLTGRVRLAGEEATA